MGRDILLMKADRRVDIAVLEETRLVEYYPFFTAKTVLPGEIYMGQILHRISGLSAVFVEIGTGKPAFLPLDGKDMTEFSPGRELPVQIQKVPVGEKGAAVTDVLSFSSKYVVLTPCDSRISVSGKITNTAERDRLRQIGRQFPGAAEEVGYILRTESAEQPETVLYQEAEALYQIAAKIKQQIRYTPVGKCMYRSLCPWMELLLEFPEKSIGRIVTDSKECWEQLSDHLSAFPSLKEKLGFHEDPRWTLSDVCKVSSQLERAQAKQIFLPDGGYLFIEETEAMAVIDVNSAKKVKGTNKEDVVFLINQKAAKEAMAQIRLRNLSGIIIIDFIDMKDPAHQAQLLSLVKEEAKKDRRLVTVHGFTHLGLMELTRERKGLSLSHQPFIPHEA